LLLQATKNWPKSRALSNKPVKLPSFIRFVGPSVGLMLLLMALPLVVTFYLSVRNCALEMEVVTVKETTPFGTQETVTQRAKVDASGQTIQTCRFVGMDYFKKVLGIDEDTSSAARTEPPDAASASSEAARLKSAQSTEFTGALKFTLLYTLVTTPFAIVLGFLVALAVNQSSPRIRAFLIAASLLPTIITPIVGGLAIKWLFRDNGLVPYFLSYFDVSIFWMAQAWSARLLVILYGIWHSAPFAFIVLYAGLQSVPQDSLEAATIDGASRWQKLRYVTLPHLAPLFIFIALINLMDAYRVFEPVVVLTQGAFTTSVQYLTYAILTQENNPYKASAAAVLTTLGIAALILPLLVKTWRERRAGT
jgi:multiple sugar transport system permease protein